VANIIRWEPFRELAGLPSAMDDLFERNFRSFGNGGSEGYFPIDVTETGEELKVKAQLPGVKPEDVEISVHGNVLTIKGQTQEEETSEGQNWHRREIRSGSFMRSFTLPSDVDADKARADFEDGLLKLTLPKSEAAKPRRIAISQTTTTGS
jgi:HSP20 family protein